MKNDLLKFVSLFVFFAIILSACSPSASKNKVAPTALSKPPLAASLSSPTSKPGNPVSATTQNPNANNTESTPKAGTSNSQSDSVTLHFTGKGDKSLVIAKWNGASVLHITHDGKNEFIVHNYDAKGTDIGEMINTIGGYDGMVAADLEKTQTSRLDIKADGNWVVDIFPVEKQLLHQIAVPGHYAGTGDDVIFLTGSVPDVGTFKTEATDGSFIVHTFTGADLYGIVHESNPYSGTAIVPSGTIIMIVQTTGNWSVDISAN